MKTKFYSVALLALVLCGSSLMSFAKGGAAWGGRGGYGHMATELNLTQAQKAQIKTLMHAQHATMRPIMQQLEQNRLSMLNASANGAFNQATVQSLATQRAQLMAQLMVQKASIRSQIYNQVLTPEQKATAETLRQNQIAQLNQRLQAQTQAGSQPSEQ
jgi:Spy/CpxP family protein refolding chaperone